MATLVPAGYFKINKLTENTGLLRIAENMCMVFARCQRPAAGSAFGAKTRLLKTSTTLPVSGSCFGSYKLFERIHSNAMNY